MRDETGRSMHPYAQWTRQWIAEENRHGDVLGRYLYLSGRVDMKQGAAPRDRGWGMCRLQRLGCSWLHKRVQCSRRMKGIEGRNWRAPPLDPPCLPRCLPICCS